MLGGDSMRCRQLWFDPLKCVVFWAHGCVDSLVGLSGVGDKW